MLLAKDIMRSRVVTLDPEMPAGQAARLFERLGISGAPVVGKRGKLLGVLSQTDLLRPPWPPPATPAVPAFYSEGDRAAPARPIETAGAVRVADLMTAAVLSAQERTPVSELARFMIARRIHRVVITREGALCGVVTTMDLLRLLTPKARAPRRAGTVRKAGSGKRRGRGRSAGR